MARTPARRDSLELTPMVAAETDGDTAARPSSGAGIDDADDGCRKLPWGFRFCSNRMAVGIIAASVLLVALAASLLLRSGSLSDNSSFAAPFVLHDALTFAVLGDWGRSGLYGQQETAASLAKWANAANVSFIVSAGDNFYEDGVSDVRDAQFDASWRSVYAAPGVQKPWLVAFGNHDYRGSLAAQEEYSKDSRWAAFRNRSVTWALPNNGSGSGSSSCVAIVLVDTTPLVQHYWDAPDAGTEMARNLAATHPAEQLAWLNASLGAAAAACVGVVVVGHHPGLSCNNRGNNADIISKLFPAITTFGVDAYVSGHDHHLAHLTLRKRAAAGESGRGADAADGEAVLDQIVSGGGSLRDLGGHTTPEAVWWLDASGFTLHSFNATHAQHTFVHGLTGRVVYTFTRQLKPKRGRGSSAASGGNSDGSEASRVAKEASGPQHLR